MLVILKKSNKNNKGLIVFSHREKPTIDFIFNKNIQLKNKIVDKYYIVIHTGWYLKNMIDYDYIDSYFSAPGNIANIDNIKEKIIPISSRGFIPKDFYYNNEVKDIDVIVITNAAKHKSPEKIIELEKELIKHKKDSKAIFVVSYPADRNKKRMDEAIEKRFWNAIKKSKYRENFTFLSVYAHDGLYLLPRWIIAKLMKSCKFYLHTCEKEGESRSIGEALVAECVVLSSKNITGGTGELSRNNHNCYLYETISQATNLILDSKTSYKLPSFSKNIKEVQKLLSNYCISRSICQENEVTEMMRQQDLSMILPEHQKRNYINKAKVMEYLIL